MRKTYLTALALAAGLAVAVSASMVMALGDPIPGVDIIVKENPGGRAFVAATSDAAGRFSASVKEPGDYTLSTACHAGSRCQPYALRMDSSGGRMSANEASASGALKTGAFTPTTYNFTVGPREPFVVSGVVVSTGDPGRQ